MKGSKLWQLLACSVITFPKYISDQCLLQAEICMIGRAYMGEVLTQVWLKFIKKWVSSQKESLKKYFRGSRKLPQAHEKVCDENETKKQNDTRKNVIDGRKHFIGRLRKTDENDLDKLRVNNSGHNEGTICLVNG